MRVFIHTTRAICRVGGKKTTGKFSCFMDVRILWGDKTAQKIIRNTVRYGKKPVSESELFWNIIFDIGIHTRIINLIRYDVRSSSDQTITKRNEGQSFGISNFIQRGCHTCWSGKKADVRYNLYLLINIYCLYILPTK